MLSAQYRDTIHKRQDTLRPCDERSYALPNSVPVCETPDRNYRHAKVKRIGDAGGHNVGRAVERITCRIEGVVVAFEILIIVRVAKAEFIHQGRTRGPGPGSQCGLCPRVLLIQPFRPDNGCRIAHHRATSLAEEIHSIHRIVVINVVVDLPQPAMDRVGTGDGGVHRRTRPWVYGEKSQETAGRLPRHRHTWGCTFWSAKTRQFRA